ncbi:hypothetical protein ECC14_05835 [Helicobacter pylori]|nr:hypothetical protein C2R59_02855 [Helicobacter pylori]RKV48880.1 hypothetical protein DD771_04560 [Helicobacter pylori]RVY32478.1 hypothetical protein ECC14_05835 [Helicobacter pylori]
MKGISLIKIEFKGYALEFKKKMILQEMRIKKGLKTTKTQVKANGLKKRLKTLFSVFCFRFINLFRLRPH